MTQCTNCKFWTTRNVTQYTDGSVVVNFESPDGRGVCSVLGQLTDHDFGCNKFVTGTEHEFVSEVKEGAPWQHSHAGPCPDCSGAGSSEGVGAGCRRCVGTGKVRHYDDGHVGEERTRKHPMELDQPVEENPSYHVVQPRKPDVL